MEPSDALENILSERSQRVALLRKLCFGTVAVIFGTQPTRVALVYLIANGVANDRSMAAIEAGDSLDSLRSQTCQLGRYSQA